MSIDVSEGHQIEKTKQKKIDWQKARRDEKTEAYQQYLLKCWQFHNIEQIVQAIREAARVLPRKGNTNRCSTWWNKDLTTMRKACIEAREDWGNACRDKKVQAEMEYRKKKREYINAQRDERRKRQKEDDVRKDIECQQRSRRYYQMIRSCAPKRAIGRIQVDEEVIYQPREIAQAFLRHFIQTAMPIEDPNFNEPWKKMVEDIVNTTCSEYERSLQDLKQVKIVTESKVSNIIQRLKKRKAPGTDEITAEHLFEAERELSRPIANCIREIMKTAKIPENFKCGLITPVFKGHGNKPEAPDSYRDISVLTVLCKVFEKVLIQRLDEGLRKAGIPSELQIAYQKERNTLQANLILREVISANRDVGKTVYVAYLDVRKCFNSVWHAGLIYKLIEAKIQPRLVLVLYNPRPAGGGAFERPPPQVFRG